MSLALKTTAFANGGEISKRHTCSGADLSVKGGVKGYQ
jgi:phosphatidylethanolamine-binding protein (PEBP) family uncharacterized protein